MELKQFTIDFKEIGKEKSFRFDVDYINFQSNFLSENCYNFNQLFEFSNNDDKVDVKDLDDDFLYSEISNVSKEGDVEPVMLNFNERNEENENYFKKIEKGDIIKAQVNEILLSKVRPNLKKYVLIDDENSKFYYTSAFIHLIPKKLNKILYYSFRSIFYNNIIAISRQGKGYPTLNENDMLYLKFDKAIIDNLIKYEKKIISKIEAIEQDIKELKKQIIPTRKIINKVFAEEFKFDMKKFKKLKKEKFFEIEISQINTPLIRSTVIQNKPSLNFIKKFLTKDSIFLKNIIINKIKRGKQPEYVDDGIKVIKTINIQDGNVTFDEVQFVSKNFFNLNKEKAGVYINDLLLTSTGMGRGKFALYINDEPCFADSHISIIRFNQKLFMPDFLNYYCQSFLGTEQLKYIETQIKGTPEIYEEQLNYFQIIKVSLPCQRKIIDKIKGELDNQEEIKQKIICLKNQFNLIIEEFINL